MVRRILSDPLSEKISPGLQEMCKDVLFLGSVFCSRFFADTQAPREPGLTLKLDDQADDSMGHFSEFKPSDACVALIFRPGVTLPFPSHIAYVRLTPRSLRTIEPTS